MRIVYVFLIVMVGVLSACGAADDVGRLAASSVDDIARAASVSDELADDALHAALRAHNLSDDAIRAAPLADDLTDDVARAAARANLEPTTVADDVAYLSATVDAQTNSLANRIRGGAGVLSDNDVALLGDLLQKLTCMYLEEREPEDIARDVATLLDQSSLVDSPLTRARIAAAAYYAASEVREASEPSSVPLSIVVFAYCAS